MPVSAASAGRLERVYRALDEDRRARGDDRNRNAADQQLEPSHGNPPRSAYTPGTTQGGRAAR
jgi:hypothetical protein